jgi:hypothetical protein
MYEEISSEDLVRHYSYLRGSRADPAPWSLDGGASTSPLQALTPERLEILDSRSRPVESRTGRTRTGRRRTSVLLAVMVLMAAMALVLAL